MNTISNILRSIFSIIIVIVFLTILTLTPIVLSVTSLLTQRQHILSWVSGSGVYQEVANGAVEKVKENLKKSGLDAKSIKELTPKLEKTINASFVQKMADNIIHGTYDWLEGKNDSIKVETSSLDLQTVLKDFIPKDQLKNQDFMQLLNSLKACTNEEALKYEKLGGFPDPKDFCIPPSLNLIKITDKSYEENIKYNSVTSSNIFQIPEISQSNSTLIKTSFEILKNSPYIIGALLILLLILYVIITPTRFFKMYAISFLIFINVMISIFVWKSTQILSKVPQIILGTVDFKDIDISRVTIEKLISLILNDISSNAVIYSLWILIACGIILAITITTHILSEKRKV